jgi:hypothetical protein
MKRDDIINRITEAVDGLLDSEELRELIEVLEHHPDLEKEFHAQMKRPDIIGAYETVQPRPGYELRLAARLNPDVTGIDTRPVGAYGSAAGHVAALEEEIIRFFRRYVIAGGLAAVVLAVLIFPQARNGTITEAEMMETWLYGSSADELISEAVLPEWIETPVTGDPE